MLNPNAANFYPQSIKIGFNYYVITISFSKSVPLNPEAKSFFSSHIDQNNNMADVPALSNLPCMKLSSHISSVDNYFSAVNANVNTAYCRILPMLNIRANSFFVISKNPYARSASYQCGNTCDDSSNVYSSHSSVISNYMSKSSSAPNVYNSHRLNPCARVFVSKYISGM